MHALKHIQICQKYFLEYMWCKSAVLMHKTMNDVSLWCFYTGGTEQLIVINSNCKMPNKTDHSSIKLIRLND